VGCIDKGIKNSGQTGKPKNSSFFIVKAFVPVLFPKINCVCADKYFVVQLQHLLDTNAG
jgi:hypothetical protein